MEVHYDYRRSTLELTKILLPLLPAAGIKGVHPHALLVAGIFNPCNAEAAARRSLNGRLTWYRELVPEHTTQQTLSRKNKQTHIQTNKQNNKHK